MNSSVRLWAVTAALVVISLAPKLAMTDEEGRRGEPAPAPHVVLGTFLAEAGVEELTSVHGKLPSEAWAGWRFEAGGCETIALPLTPGGELDDFVRQTAGPGREVRFVFDGRVSREAPRFAATARRLVDRAAYRLGLRGEPRVFYVGLLHPQGCEGALTLPWQRL